MRFFLYALLIPFGCFAQTPFFVPRADLEGSLGTSNKQWGSVYSGNVFVGGEAVTSLIAKANVASLNGVTGAVEIIGGDGISVVATNGNVFVSLVDPDGIPAVGTNRVYFQYTGYTNYWTAPAGITNIAIWAWGGGGGSGDPVRGSRGGSGGFSYLVFPVVETSILSIVVGGGGGYAQGVAIAYGGWPNGGNGINRSTSSQDGAGGGGGMSAIYFGSEIIIIAGGGGGGGGGSSTFRGGGPGGGLSGGNGTVGSQGGGGGGTQTEGGYGSYQIENYLLGQTNTSGSFLLGGNSGATNLSFTSTVGSGGGGGGGYFGGGGTLTLGTASFGGGGGGGGGSGYINPFGNGVSIRGVGATPAGTELAEYISGTGGTSYPRLPGNNGLIVIGY